MRRNGTRFALISVGERGHQTLLLRLSAVLRNAFVMCGKLIKHCNFFHKTTCPEFRPSLPPGLSRPAEQCDTRLSLDQESGCHSADVARKTGAHRHVSDAYRDRVARLCAHPTAGPALPARQTPAPAWQPGPDRHT